MKLEPAQLEKTKLSLQIHAEIDREHGELKHRHLAKYIGLIADRQVDMGMADAVVIIPGIHESRKTEVENILKGFQFKITTEIQVYWRDESQPLWALYQVKNKDENQN